MKLNKFEARVVQKLDKNGEETTVKTYRYLFSEEGGMTKHTIVTNVNLNLRVGELFTSDQMASIQKLVVN